MADDIDIRGGGGDGGDRGDIGTVLNKNLLE